MARYAPWDYRGITIERHCVTGYWTALVNLPGYAGYLKADTKVGMMQLIRAYS